MARQLGDWEPPRVLLVVLTAVTVVVLVVAASTSTAAFGTYNPAWDGASDLQDVARAVDADATVIHNLEGYDRAEPDETVAVILAPREPYSATEAATLRRFVEQGGTLVVADDFGASTDGLLAALGARSRIDGSLVRDERSHYRSPAVPVATNVTPHPLTAGVEALTVNHASFIEPNGATVLVRTSGFAYADANRNGELDSDEALGTYPLVSLETVGDGRLVVVSDPSLFINVMLERPGNAAFVRNLFGAHEAVVLDYSHAGGLPPLSLVVLILRGSVGLQLLVGLGGIAVIAGWTAGRLPTPSVGALGTPSSRSAPSWTEDELVAYLGRQHPDWEDERVRRIVRGIMGRGRESGGDE